MLTLLRNLETGTENWMRRFGVAVLQFTLGGASVWLGLLKIFGRSALMPVIHVAFPALPYPEFITVLGVWETAIGIGLLLPLLPLPRWLESVSVRIALILLFLQLLGWLWLVVFSPAAFFTATPPNLTVVGDFLIRNLMFLASAIVIAGHIRSPENSRST